MDFLQMFRVHMRKVAEIILNKCKLKFQEIKPQGRYLKDFVWKRKLHEIEIKWKFVKKMYTQKEPDGQSMYTLSVVINVVVEGLDNPLKMSCLLQLIQNNRVSKK